MFLHAEFQEADANVLRGFSLQLRVFSAFHVPDLRRECPMSSPRGSCRGLQRQQMWQQRHAS
jgi:hypothetical protein